MVRARYRALLQLCQFKIRKLSSTCLIILSVCLSLMLSHVSRFRASRHRQEDPDSLNRFALNGNMCKIGKNEFYHMSWIRRVMLKPNIKFYLCWYLECTVEKLRWVTVMSSCCKREEEQLWKWRWGRRAELGAWESQTPSQADPL